MDPIGTFRRRAAKRIIRDLPLDLAETELDDPLGLLRGKVRASLDSAQRWERGKAAPARRAWFGIPSVPDISRLTSVAGGQGPIMTCSSLTPLAILANLALQTWPRRWFHPEFWTHVVVAV